MLLEQFVEQDFEKALEAVASIAAVKRAAFVKQADPGLLDRVGGYLGQAKDWGLKQLGQDGLSGAAGQVGDYLKANPWAQYGLYGLGGGAAAGLIGNTLFGQKGKKRPFSSALLGGLTGAGLGVGAGMLQHNFGGGLAEDAAKKRQEALLAEADRNKADLANKNSLYGFHQSIEDFKKGDIGNAVERNPFTGPFIEPFRTGANYTGTYQSYDPVTTQANIDRLAAQVGPLTAGQQQDLATWRERLAHPDRATVNSFYPDRSPIGGDWLQRVPGVEAVRPHLPASLGNPTADLITGLTAADIAGSGSRAFIDRNGTPQQLIRGFGTDTAKKYFPIKEELGAVQSYLSGNLARQKAFLNPGGRLLPFTSERVPVVPVGPPIPHERAERLLPRTTESLNSLGAVSNPRTVPTLPTQRSWFGRMFGGGGFNPGEVTQNSAGEFLFTPQSLARQNLSLPPASVIARDAGTYRAIAAAGRAEETPAAAGTAREIARFMGRPFGGYSRLLPRWLAYGAAPVAMNMLGTRNAVSTEAAQRAQITHYQKTMADWLNQTGGRTTLPEWALQQSPPH
jgi:hypothetical protein